MEKKLFFFSLFFLLPYLSSCVPNQVYIVYLGEHNGDKTVHEIGELHHSYLSSVKPSVEHAKSSLIYSYKHSINGFAAVLSEDEASKLTAMDDVVSVRKSDPKKYTMHTTRSWGFVGLDERLGHGKPFEENAEVLSKKNGLLHKAKYGTDVIIGVLDSGVWPESESFSDVGMGPVPKTWKGICQTGDEFDASHCNRKLIGARYYLRGYEYAYGKLNRTLDYQSPRDKDGHGSHTASTAAGHQVEKAEALGGFARGTASGGAPLARLAIYKVCWAIPGQSKANGNTCFEEDMLAAMDDAIGDGVDVLSISIGTAKPTPLVHDGIALGAYHATKKNIVVSCSAGNSGPAPSTLSNTAPWIITVGASSVDRKFIAPIKLGNGMLIEGQTVTPGALKKKKMYPLVYAGNASVANVTGQSIGQCLPGTLLPEQVKGKIVLCMRGLGSRVGKGMEVTKAGGVGIILGNPPAFGDDLTADAHFIPATAVSAEGAIKILSYIQSTKNPEANILRAKTLMHAQPAPYMAAFTSRGPNVIDPNLLKPDITAPGINILAAWTGGNSPTKLENDPRIVKYNILSGTSMSCPHVAGVAALLKAVHRDWTTAAIRSALVTTAGLTNNKGMFLTDPSGKQANSFQFGSGHIKPTKAYDPGLVYDATFQDYQVYLCSAPGGHDFDPSIKCPKNPPSSNTLNYPSLTINNYNGTVTVQRTVTNVGGNGKSIYFSTVKPPMGFSVQVKPSLLFFDHVGQKKTFTITVKVKAREDTSNQNNVDEYAFGWYTWTDGVHHVRSPLVVSHV